MGRRILFCITCNAKYDVGAVAPGCRFLCRTCRTTIKVPELGVDFADPALETEPVDLEIMPADLIIGSGGSTGLDGLSFTKLNGTGNDFVLVDCIRESIDDPEEAARVLCDRRFGIGSDGLLLLLPAEGADVRMRMFNPDGREAEACGNGLRCLVKYACDHGHVSGRALTVETAGGPRLAEVRRTDGIVDTVRVGMGAPSTEPGKIPAEVPGNDTLGVAIEAGGTAVEGTLVSMGNPHCVVFVPDVDRADVETLGPAIENHPMFPNRTNVEFVQVVSPTLVRQRTWERGAGETLACGSGACAACVAGNLLGRTERNITVSLRGGDLQLDWSESGELFLDGPATEIFTGLWCHS